MKEECCGKPLLKESNLKAEYNKIIHDHGYCSTRFYVCPYCKKTYTVEYERDAYGEHFSKLREYFFG